ncbi:MAG: Bax inhibitor-1 family protein [Chloroflexota bacterium]
MSVSYETTYDSMRSILPAIALQEEDRSRFITRTYTHLMGAILGFTLIEMFLFTSGLAYPIASGILSLPWLAILGAFMIVSWLATRMAHNSKSKVTQYAALSLFVVAEAIIFVPLLLIAEMQAGGGVIQNAALTTLLGFGGLTWVAFSTRKDFSFLGSLLRWGMIVALVLIVAGVIFGFDLGVFFSVAMIAIAGGAILYDTSNVLHHYQEDRYVAAALQLFASVALMFWYVLQLFLSLSRN